MKTIMEDKREISRIEIFSYYSSDVLSYSAREDIKIEPYYEGGEMGNVVWFAVCKKGSIVSRVNSKYVQVVEYKEPNGSLSYSPWITEKTLPVEIRG